MNPRQKFVPLEDLVDANNPQRDGVVTPHDPTMTKMANAVRHMRKEEMPWPEAMLLYGVNKEGRLNCAFIMPISQFETITTERLFALCNSEAVKLYFFPSQTMPPDDVVGKAMIDKWLSVTPQEVFQKQTLYLDVNEWWVMKPCLK